MADAPTPRIRATAAEREATVAQLQRAVAAGQLTLAEFEVRCDQALAAIYRDELPALLEALTSDPSAAIAATGPRNPRWTS